MPSARVLDVLPRDRTRSETCQARVPEAHDVWRARRRSPQGALFTDSTPRRRSGLASGTLMRAAKIRLRDGRITWTVLDAHSDPVGIVRGWIQDERDLIVEHGRIYDPTPWEQDDDLQATSWHFIGLTADRS